MDFTDVLNVRAYDLGQPYFPGMPHFPSHPPFLYSLTKKHGDLLYRGGATSAADAIALGTHVGTHIDALSHFSCNGVFYRGGQVKHTYEHGMGELGVETVAPIVRRGVLLDIVRFEGVDALPASFEVTAMSVHTHLLVESGIHIIEVLNLEELARDGVYEFIFVPAPLNIRGATGAPVRPLAFPKAGSI
jgi:kynurenine formamidase